MTPEQLIQQWRRGLRISHRAHFESAKYYARLHGVIATPALVISAMLGTAVFASLQRSDIQWVKFLLAVLSVLMIVLTSLQSFFRHAERSERHKTAAVQVGEIRRALEQRLVFTAVDDAALKDFREQWDAVDRQAPTIPTRIYERVEATVKGDEDIGAHTPGV